MIAWRNDAICLMVDLLYDLAFVFIAYGHQRSNSLVGMY